MKHELRERWKLRDLEGFAAQELRWKNYIEIRRKGKIPKASVALPVLHCKLFIDSENVFVYDYSYDVLKTSFRDSVLFYQTFLLRFRNQSLLIHYQDRKQLRSIYGRT